MDTNLGNMDTDKIIWNVTISKLLRQCCTCYFSHFFKIQPFLLKIDYRFKTYRHTSVDHIKQMKDKVGWKIKLFTWDGQYTRRIVISNYDPFEFNSNMSSIKLADKNAIKFLLQWYAPKPTIEQMKLMHITIKMIGYDRYPTFIAQVKNVWKHAGST